MALRRKPEHRPQPKSTASTGRSQTRRREDSRRREFNSAVRSGKLEVAGEPIIEVSTGRLLGCEAVVKMSADGLADRSGDAAAEPSATRCAARSKLVATRATLAAVDDDHVVAVNRLLVEGIRAVVDHQQLDLQDDSFVSVTVDGRFVADDLFLDTVKDAVRLAGLQASQLLLSINAEPGFEGLWSKLQRLKSHGAQVAVHDFALGSASTETLRRYPFNMVRFAMIDPEPATGSATSEVDDSLLHSTVKLAHNLGCRTIADDVQTTTELERIGRAGGDAAHGLLDGADDSVSR